MPRTNDVGDKHPVEHAPHGESKHDAPFTRPVKPVHHQGPARPVIQQAKVHSHNVRENLATLMDATCHNERNWHYHAVRPLSYPTLVQAEHAAVTSDCSFGCSILAKLAGAQDPLGSHFNGWGNSTSMFTHLKHIAQKDVQVGDFAVFGHHNGEMHAVCIRQPGGDPLCWSHGQEKGPFFVRMSVEKAAHPGATVTYLRLEA